MLLSRQQTFSHATDESSSRAQGASIYDRQLSLPGAPQRRDANMLLTGRNSSHSHFRLSHNSVIAGRTLTVSDPSKGVIANDVAVYGVKVSTPPVHGTLTLNEDGTFTYVANTTWSGDSFAYCANGAASGTVNLCTTVALGAAPIETGGIAVNNLTYTSQVATFLKIVQASCRSTRTLRVIH